ncbi:MAG: DUF4355 domain-containing protein [Clostridia bacterium]|nr:DUF4355 domain-containing protein [Clostridia bacterium]
MEENIAIKMENTASPEEARPGQDFDALLRDRDFQSEFDRRISRALETARSKWAQETERRIERARAEAEALARMSGEERMAHDFARREAELNEREGAIARRELRAEAAKMIAERSLPPELAEALNYESAERVAESLDAAERAFKNAVQSGVEKRMSGQVPAAARAGRSGEVSDAEYYRTHYGVR